MTPDISYFIPDLLVETDKYTEVSGGNFVTANQTEEIQIKIRNDNVKPLIDMLYCLLLTIDLCN